MKKMNRLWEKNRPGSESMKQHGYHVCTVTSTRADFGILSGLLKKIQQDPEFNLTMMVTGTHLKKEYGYTIEEIREEGFTELVELDIMQNPSDPVKMAAKALEQFGAFFKEKKPDLVLLLGDRSEILAVAMAAMLNQIPIAHLHGGERTEGAVDEACRHAITKMGQLHFTATEVYRNRVIQLGEQPDHVYNVGALGVENIHNVEKYTKEEVYRRLDIPEDQPFIIVTFHPQTLSEQQIQEQLQPLTEVMGDHPEFHYIITKANADQGGELINKLWEEECNKHPNWRLFASLGRRLYFSSLQQAVMVMGNSSSGLIEAPSFHLPTIDIGDRQQGRVAAESVLHCDNTAEQIEMAVKEALCGISENRYSKVCNPYEKPHTAETIVSILKKELGQGIDTRKCFYDITENNG